MKTKWMSGVSIGMIALTATSCGWFGDDKKGGGEAALIQEKDKGCAQGVLLDGITGERLAVADSSEKEGVHVIVRNKVLRAKTLVDGKNENAPESLKGEYYICGIPVDGEYPLFANVEGYQPFESAITIDSATANLTAQSQAPDRKIEYPNTNANIYLYPLGTESNDLKFNIVSDGADVADAVVQLQPTGSNLVRAGTMRPQIRVAPTAVKTDEHGVAIFSGKNLVLGGQYRYTVLPKTGEAALTVASGEVTVGYRSAGAGLADLPFEVSVNLSESVTRLRAVSQTRSSSADGSATLIFNQDIELAPYGADRAVARLSGARNAKLSGDAAGIGSLDFKITGKKLEIFPKWEITPKQESEAGAFVTISGLVVRSTDTNNTERYTVENLTVKLFD